MGLAVQDRAAHRSGRLPGRGARRSTACTCWLEGHPDEGGRQVLVRREPDGIDHAPHPGGLQRPLARPRVRRRRDLVSGDLIVVSDFVSGRLHRVVAAGRARADHAGARVALRRHGPRRGSEPAHRDPRGPRAGRGRAARRVEQRPRRDRPRLGRGHGARRRLRTSTARLGSRRTARTLAWLEWHHPNMPWDGTELRLATIAADGSLADPADDRGQPAGLGQPAALVARGHPPLRGRADGLDEPASATSTAGSSRSPTYEAEFVGPDWQFGYTTTTSCPTATSSPSPARAGATSLSGSTGTASSRRSTCRTRRCGSISIDGDRVDPPRCRAGAARRRSPRSTSHGNVDGPPPRHADRARARGRRRSPSTSSSRRRAAGRPTATSTRRPIARSSGRPASCRRSS